MADSLLATDTGGGSFEPIPAGSYPARCISVIEIGTVTETYNGEVKAPTRKIWITWEVPEVMRQWKEDEPEKPAVIGREYTLSLGEKAKLRGDLQSWRGKPFTPEELKGFEIINLIGAKCLLGIIEESNSEGKKRNKITSIMAPVKGMEIPDMINEKKVLTYSNFNLEIFETLPEFLKTKMKTSKEYIMITSPAGTGTTATASQPVSAVEEEDSDDLPF